MSRDLATFVSWARQCLTSSPPDDEAIESAWRWASIEIGTRTAIAVALEGWVDATVTSAQVSLGGGPAIALRRPGAFGHPAADVESSLDPRVADPLVLWRWLCERRPVDASADARVEAELADSRFNLALCRLWSSHASPRDPPDGESCVVLGHPWHPMTKTRLGLSLQEHLRFAPELEARGPLRSVDVRRELARTSENFSARVEPRFGRADDGWLRIPVHGGQFDRLPRLLGSRLGRDVRPVDGGTVEGRSLLSMRTVAFDDSHYKLALDVHTTSARRVVSAMSVTNGPRVSALLDRIAATDPSTARGIRVAGEHDTGGLDSSLVGELAHHVGVIVRNADDFCCPEGTVVCCAALGSTRPGASAPILAELVAGYRQPEPQERAAAMLADYTGLLLPPLLRLLSHWGIALEPHLQNTLVEIVDGRPAGFIVRDLGGIRIHGGRLRAAGESLEVHPDSFIVTDDLAELRGKLAHCALHAHLGTLVGWLEDHLGLPAKRAWSTVAEVIRDAYGGIRHDDLEALAAPRVRAKALFTMRIQDRSSEYHYFETDNPLAQALASNPT